MDDARDLEGYAGEENLDHNRSRYPPIRGRYSEPVSYHRSVLHENHTDIKDIVQMTNRRTPLNLSSASFQNSEQVGVILRSLLHGPLLKVTRLPKLTESLLTRVARSLASRRPPALYRSSDLQRTDRQGRTHLPYLMLIRRLSAGLFIGNGKGNAFRRVMKTRKLSEGVIAALVGSG
ncbi:hypothetical protein EVAR_60278_1 [Eumeta japonica]|uniref:Uncharacterized protein n=1 Tax=Eumeta variegata TaxID=151549 RepID=A0A4C1ZCL7_EUMVA|nr:hypothetical protein EVAR_60278_1 [Eumeta japonica]